MASTSHNLTASRRRRGPRRFRPACASLAAIALAATLALGAAPTSAPAPPIAAARTGPRTTTQPAELTPHLHLEDEFDLSDLDLFSLEVPSVVTGATRREQKVSAMPHAVSVVTADDIRRSGARNIADALRMVPGLDIADLGYANSAVAPRGLHGFVARNTLILVDGRQIFDSLFGGSSWSAWPFMLEDIARIEVIRGPAGVTWGPNAVNGVINIVTKDPVDQQGLTTAAGGAARGSGWGYSGYGITVDKLRLRVSGEYERTDGFRHGGSILRGLNDDYATGRGSVHAVYDATPNDSFTLSGGHSTASNLYPPPPLGLLNKRDESGAQGTYLLGRWRHRVAADNSVEVSTYFNDSWSSPGMRTIDYRYQQLAFQIGHSFKPAPEHTLTYGFDSRVDLLDTTNADPQLCTKDYVSSAILGAYLEDEWRFAPRWTLTLGGRVDYETYGGFQPSGRLSLARELGANSMAYVAISRGYQMPPAGMRHLETPLLGGPVYFTADQDVKATSIIAYEAGYRTRLFDRLNLDVNLFCHDYNDYLIEHTTLGPPGLLIRDLRNGAQARAYGMEWEGRYNVNNRLTLLGSYTLQVTDWQGPESIDTTDIMPAPRHKFGFGARYDATEQLHLSAHLYYVGSTRAPYAADVLFFHRVEPYVRLDLRAEYEFWKQRAAVAVGVRNLTDPDHWEGGTRFLNNAEVPRMVYGELRFRLD